MEPFIVAITGKKQSGKSTLCTYLKDYFLPAIPRPYLGNAGPPKNDVKIYNFADPLKRLICMQVLGLPEHQVYGTDEQKNELTPYTWENLPLNIAYEHSCANELRSVVNKLEFGGQETTTVKVPVPKTGFMTAREVLQVVGTDIFRNYFSSKVWVNATFRKIREENPRIALLGDTRFPSEVDAVIEAGGHVIRLTKQTQDNDQHESETALDEFNWSQKNCYLIDNREMTIEQKDAIAITIIKGIMEKNV